MRRLVDIGLIERLAVHVHDARVKVNVHDLVFRGNDALDDRLIHKRLLAQHDNVALLRRKEQIGNDHLVVLLQRRVHGGADDIHHPRHEHEQKHAEDQRRNDALDPVIHFAARAALRFFRRCLAFVHTKTSVPKLIKYIIHEKYALEQQKNDPQPIFLVAPDETGAYDRAR